MEFIIQASDQSIKDMVQQIGYVPLDYHHFHRGDEFGMVRKLNKNDYPRFHLYVKTINGGDNGYKLTLCLENSLSGTGKKYRGPLIEKEVKRLKELLMGKT